MKKINPGVGIFVGLVAVLTIFGILGAVLHPSKQLVDIPLMILLQMMG